MSWIEHHRVSERLASKAEAALRVGNSERARAFYARAADAEHDAVMDLDGAKTRTFVITWVSVASLYYKAGMLERAEEVAWKILNLYSLPDFAKQQLKNLLQLIWGSLNPHTPSVQAHMIEAFNTIEKRPEIVEIDMAILSTYATNNIALDFHVPMRTSMPLRMVSESKVLRLLLGPRTIRKSFGLAPVAETPSPR